MKRFLAALGLSALSSLAGAATGDAHFAQRFALDLDGNAAYYAVTVPQAVYAASLHGDLADLRVFNGAGEPVPYSLDAPVPAGPPPQLRADDASAATPRQWRDGARVRAGQSPGEYLFETDGAYPVDRLRVELPQPNTVARATVQSRANAQAPWRDVANGVLFRLRGQAGEQRNPPLELSPDRDRTWRIVVDTRNGGLGGGMPSVAVGWRPASLTFLARGAPPFTLAVGNARLASAAVRRDELLIGAGTAISSAHIGHALPVSPQEARAAATTDDADATRRHVLWTALVVAVGTLGTIAWRLSRGGRTQDREGR
ncbi:conserved exported protein of unknown function [Burkholderia multivorans]